MERRKQTKRKKVPKDREITCVQELRQYLKDNLEMSHLHSPLLCAGLLSHDDSERMDRAVTNADKVDVLILALMDSRDSHVLDTFIKLLYDNEHRHVVPKLREAGKSLRPHHQPLPRRNTSASESAAGPFVVAMVDRPVRRATVRPLVTDDTLTQLSGLWKLPPDEAQTAMDGIMQQLIEQRNARGIILLHLQSSLRKCFQDDVDGALMQVDKCVQDANLVEDDSTRRDLLARCLSVKCVVCRVAKKFGDAQTYIDLAQQQLTTIEAGEIQVMTMFHAGRLAMDIFLATGIQDYSAKATSYFEKVLGPVGAGPRCRLTNVIQSSLLNMAITYLGYPGGEHRCSEPVTDASINDASKCLARINCNPTLMADLVPRTRCHLIRTEGDLYFRQGLFEESIAKLEQSKRLSQENGFRVDVKYCDTRLAIVHAKSNMMPHHGLAALDNWGASSAASPSTQSTDDADHSNVESSDQEELLRSVTAMQGMNIHAVDSSDDDTSS